MRNAIPLLVVASLLLAGPLTADLFFTTSTLDSADLDFDGAGMETDGELPGVGRTFTFSGSDVPAEFVDIDSFTIIVEQIPDTSLSARVGPEAGIGLRFADSAAEEIGSLDTDGFEELFFGVEFVSSNPNQELFLSGVSFTSFDGTMAQARLFDATHNGGEMFVLGTANPDVVFDDGVSFFSVTSTGFDSFRISGIRLGSTISGVPEPSGAILFGVLLSGYALRRRRHG